MNHMVSLKSMKYLKYEEYSMVNSFSSKDLCQYNKHYDIKSETKRLNDI